MSPEGAKARVLVAGATGYAGALAAQLVWSHPRLELSVITGRSDAGRRLNDLYPRYSVPLTLKELEETDFDEVEVGIVAYPHGAAAPVVAQMRGRGLLVVDLSADFRFDSLPDYEKAYGPHSEPGLLDGAVYGLPELERARIAEAELVANPGCYPTATILALAPLAQAGLLEDVVVDAKSGVSGAGRGGGEGTAFVTITENVNAYKPSGHRHRPEIAEKLGLIAASGGNAEAAPERLTFVPHLVPVDQGELVSCYVTPRRQVGQVELDELYAAAYGDEPFIRLRELPPGMRDVRETNQCHVFPLVTDDRILVESAIDNLWKGASSQAIQNLNLMLGLDETEGLG
ncbi:MAG: N-acetyl-gamma-glutamyl-phosphate reductase [Solirubrobacterales bacterium]|nr:N-acetyl-gamma-glutamyl-phosphate reductase [Solirubrobacterales bacterium]MCB8914855.1 N-acetyl-gamma-glutamyl-phosphate reductase [Thermoleophilales bacterium]